MRTEDLLCLQEADEYFQIDCYGLCSFSLRLVHERCSKGTGSALCGGHLL